jgi:hypothetical protein
MRKIRWGRGPIAAALLTLAALGPSLAHTDAKGLQPLVYTIRFPDPASKTFTVNIIVPTDKRPSVDLMMAIWSPGFYGIQNYADTAQQEHLTAFLAHSRAS